MDKPRSPSTRSRAVRVLAALEAVLLKRVMPDWSWETGPRQPEAEALYTGRGYSRTRLINGTTPTRERSASTFVRLSTALARPGFGHPVRCRVGYVRAGREQAHG